MIRQSLRVFSLKSYFSFAYEQVEIIDVDDNNKPNKTKFFIVIDPNMCGKWPFQQLKKVDIIFICCEKIVITTKYGDLNKIFNKIITTYDRNLV
jgi:hypothetical protein